MTPDTPKHASGPERAPSPNPEGMSSLRREHRHALLVAVLVSYVPWGTSAAAVAFLIAWIVSMFRSTQDGVALFMGIVLTAFAGFSWVTRIALQGLIPEDDPQP